MADAKLTIKDLPTAVTVAEDADLLALWDDSDNTTSQFSVADLKTSVINPLIAAEAAIRAADDVTLQNNIDLKAPLADPALTGIPTAPTATNGTDTDQIATTAFVQDAVSSVTGAVVSVNGDTGAVVLDASSVGLGGFAGYTPATLPLSTAETAALTTKEPSISSGLSSQVWQGDKTWIAKTSLPISTAQQTALDAKEPTITGATSADVWQGDKTWTPKSGLPVSTATQTALNLKVDLSALAASTGSTLEGTIQTLTGAIARTAASKLNDVISVKDFGATGNGTTLDTAAFQAAIDALPAAGGTIYIPGGQYRLDQVNVNKPVSFIGAGTPYSAACAILVNSATDDTFNVTAYGFSMIGLYFTPYTGVTKTAGAFVKLLGASYHNISNNYFQYFFVAIECDGSSLGTITNNNFRNGVRSGVTSGGSIICLGRTSLCVANYINNNVYDDDTIVPPLTQAKMISNGLDIRYCDAPIVTNNEIIHAGVDCIIRPQSGQVATNGKFRGNYFDTAYSGIIIQPASGGAVATFSFVDSWATNHLSTNTLLDASSAQITGVSFIGHNNYLGQANGMYLTGASLSNVTIDLSFHAQNTSHAILVDASVVNGVKIRHNVIGAQGNFTANGAGINLISGCANVVVTDNDVRNNTGAGIINATGGANVFVSRNQGFVTKNSGSSAVVIGQTIVTVNHGLATTPTAAQLNIIPTTYYAGSGVVNWYIGTITSTTFQMVVVTSGASVTIANFTFGWSANTEVL